MTISLFNAEALHYGRNYSIEVGGKTYKGILYEDCRITEIYRKSLHAYGLRHPDDDWGAPASISLGYPLVNFFGTFITNTPIPIEEETEITDYNEED